MTTGQLSRRAFGAGAASLAVAFRLGSPAYASSHGDGLRIDETAEAGSLAWLVLTENAVTIHSGKVELGTGVQTALTQIVAEELRLGRARVAYVQGDTRVTPDQGTTAGSKTIQNGGPQLRQAAATAFQALLGLAAQHFQVQPSRLVARDGSVYVAGSNRRVSYGRLLDDAELVLVADPAAPVARPQDYSIVGRSVARADLPDKIMARFEYLQDVRVPGMLHGRVIRPSGRNATFVSISPESLARAKAIPGFVNVVQRGNFVGVVATTEWAAIQAAAPATGIEVTWADGQPLVAQATLPAALRDPVNHYRTTQEVDVGDVDAAFATAAVQVRASYDTPFQMHAAMGPPCAVADVRTKPDRETGVQVRVWACSQAVYALRETISNLLTLPEAAIHVVYKESAGCYGHNGADDVAADAVLLSQAVGKPVRLQWSRQNEHGWEPLGAAMAHDLRGGVTDGSVVAWEHTVCTPTHGSRPNGSPGTVLAGILTGSLPANLPTTAGNSGGRNAPVNYVFPNDRLIAHLVRSFETAGPNSNVPAAPLRYRFPRTTALRSLGGFSNTFANESFLDELAVASGIDPLDLRIRSHTDPRAIAVLEALRPAWNARPAGAGLAFARYETEFTYCAVYAEVTVDETTGVVRVRRVVVAHDSGLVINPDGIRHQIEGCVVQGISRTLKEEVQYDDRGVTSVVWSTYPVLRFSEVPKTEIILLDRPDQPAWGAGEPAIEPMPAAIGNAVYAATGARIRTLPMTPARVLEALQNR